MTALTVWNPSDQVLMWGVNVLLQVTLVTTITLLIAVASSDGNPVAPNASESSAASPSEFRIQHKQPDC